MNFEKFKMNRLLTTPSVKPAFYACAYCAYFMFVKRQIFRAAIEQAEENISQFKAQSASYACSTRNLQSALTHYFLLLRNLRCALNKANDACALLRCELK